MLKATSVFAATTLVAMLAGCSTKSFYDPNYYTDTQPTVDSIKTTNGNVQMYKKTAFTLNDFNEKGELRAFEDYDFENESAPCTALREFYVEPAVRKEEFYNVKLKSGKEQLFQCRGWGHGQRHQFRLFMVGSKMECGDRSWDWSKSSFPFFQKHGDACRKQS